MARIAESQPQAWPAMLTRCPFKGRQGSVDQGAADGSMCPACARPALRSFGMYALAETINGLYKAELIHRRTTWKTRESVELATLEWVGVWSGPTYLRTQGLS